MLLVFFSSSLFCTMQKDIMVSIIITAWDTMVSLKCLLPILWFLGGISMCIGIHDTRRSSCDYSNIHPHCCCHSANHRTELHCVPGGTHNLSTDPGDHQVTWEIPETYLLNLSKVPEDFVGFNLFPEFKYYVTYSIEKQLLSVKWCRSGKKISD